MPHGFTGSNGVLSPGAAGNDLRRLESTGRSGEQAATSGLSRSIMQLEDEANRDGERQAIEEARGESRRASDRDVAQFERATAGLDLSERQKRSASSRLGLSRALSRASRAGAVRRGFTDRSRAAARVGGQFSDALFSQRVGAEGGLASAFAARKARDAARSAAKKSATIGTVGTIAGMALMFSSEGMKDNHGHEAGLLDKLKGIRVNRWNYKGDNTEHVGPFSEEFNKTFGVNKERPNMINVLDALGITLGAVKELNEKVEANGT